MSEDAEDGRLAALRELVQSEGWAILKAHAVTLFGPEGYGREMQAALSSIPAGPDRAYEIAQVAERVEATARAVNGLILWPTSQLQAATPRAPRRFGRRA
jgi:hypothetical protein